MVTGPTTLATEKIGKKSFRNYMVIKLKLALGRVNYEIKILEASLVRCIKMQYTLLFVVNANEIN